ncbi:tsl0003 [Thermosynechococcus vestitus BP-1]|uniref:Tsl0003 protein n=1 Tax=Thermosynechococcus vestitus (strain NIES-2133 / IAM M-273 / BP-1) TaxID=197221 RepID=Q8DMV8_THEVB|nr:tsl0003 [Thermosynechococcus vestitus BP-1]
MAADVRQNHYFQNKARVDLMPSWVEYGPQAAEFPWDGDRPWRPNGLSIAFARSHPLHP